MYVPDAFRVADMDELHAFVAAHPFGTLVSTVNGEPFGTHLPFVIDRSGAGTTLRAHMARANPQWRELEDGDSLAIFTGGHAYVSPAWYASRDSVPTWDYTAVHARGRARIIEDRERVIDFLRRLTAINETNVASAWSIDEIAPERLDGFLRAIVAFEIPVSRLEGQFKLSQNRSIEDRRGVVAALERIGEPQAAEVRERIRAQLGGPSAR